MRLFEIATTALIYDQFTDFNNSYMSFMDKTGSQPDLLDPAHRRALLKWLNQWQCRQFSKAHHSLASRQILAWYKGFDTARFPYELELWRMGDETIANAAMEYGRLVSKKASLRERGGVELTVTVGPTGASKILFAIRPRSMVPWDEAMRKGLKYDGSPDSYRDFLMQVRSDLDELGKACKRAGFGIRNLPVKVGRRTSTPAQLVGEYYFLTQTRGLRSEDFERVREFAR